MPKSKNKQLKKRNIIVFKPIQRNEENIEKNIIER